MHLTTSLALVTLVSSVHAFAFPQILGGPPPPPAIVPATPPALTSSGSSAAQLSPSKPPPAASPPGQINAADELVTPDDLFNLKATLDPAEILKEIGAIGIDLIGGITGAGEDPKKGGGKGKGQGGKEPPKDGKCPPVWGDISRDLSKMFITDGQCNDDARAAIRATFHDCFPDGGCDGSLATPEELSRSDNRPMAKTVTKLAKLANKRGVSTADMIVFAGSHAVTSCPGGPITPTFVGRTDAEGPAPDGQLPPPDNPAERSIAQFRARGLSTTDLAALIGAHTAAKVTAKSNTPTDTTPGKWDTLFYQQTIDRTAPITIPSDENLVATKQIGSLMARFAKDKQGFNAAFSSGMAKMELLGARKNRLVDCTGMLPRAGQKRDMLTAPLLARAR